MARSLYRKLCLLSNVLCLLLLPGYTINVDSNIRQLAGEVMHRVLRGLPHMRNAMLRGMADHVSRQPDEYPEVCLALVMPFSDPCLLECVYHCATSPRISIVSCRWCATCSF